MKRTTTKEIFIEIKTIRITKKRSAQTKPAEQPTSENSNHTSSFEKTEERLEYPLKKLFLWSV